MTKEERRDIVKKAAQRIVNNLDAMSDYSRVMYIEKLVTMLDDIHLAALDFAIEMTPEKREGK